MPSAPGGRRSGPAAAVGPAAAAAVAAAVDVALAQVAAQPERLRAAGSGVREAPRAVGGRHVGGHTGASRASPLHAPGASLAVMNASPRASMARRQEDLLTPRGWQAAPSEVPAPVANTPLKATCGAMAHQKMSA